MVHVHDLRNNLLDADIVTRSHTSDTLRHLSICWSNRIHFNGGEDVQNQFSCGFSVSEAIVLDFTGACSYVGAASLSTNECNHYARRSI